MSVSELRFPSKAKQMRRVCTGQEDEEKVMVAGGEVGIIERRGRIV